MCSAIALVIFIFCNITPLISLPNCTNNSTQEAEPARNDLDYYLLCLSRQRLD